MKWFKYIALALVFVFFYGSKRTITKKQIPAYYELELKGLNNRISNDLSRFKYSDYIDRQINRFINRNELKGVSVAVLKDEQLVFAQGYGFANSEKEKVKPGHLFRVASVSKLITAIAAMKLVEDGRLSLSDKVFGPDGIINDSIFVRVRDRRLKSITVQNLLAHSGGWTQRYGDPAFNSLHIAGKVKDNPPASIDSYLKFVAGRRLAYPPGAMVSYSNIGYMFLGEVIERVTAKDYESFVKDEILLPNNILDMHIGSSFKHEKLENEVEYFEQRGSILVPAFDGSGNLVAKSYGGNPIDLLGAAGGWICSSVELARLLVLIDGNPYVQDILSPSSLEQMQDNTYAKGPLGWRFATSTTCSRTGSMAGTAAMLKRNSNGLTWIFISNTSSWKGPYFSKDIRIFMDRITRRVKEWPNVNLFNYYPIDSLQLAINQ